jgi:DNA-binding transcriptional regulator YiaG
MTKDQFKNIRASTKMTQTEFAHHLGYIGKNAGRRVREIENGTRKIPANKELILMKEAKNEY